MMVICLILPIFHSQAGVPDSTLISDIHKRMLAGEISAQKLVNHYFERIRKLNDAGPTLNAVVQINKNALIEARTLDDYFKKNGLIGPLHGIPVLLKDNIDTNDGMANTAGSYALKDNFPSQDADLVKQLRKAGAIILGKTNLSEWANMRSSMSSSGWSGLYGQTLNPYDTSTSPCGSSSGSAVAVAANFAVLAVGTETDGSVTCPAAVNGIVGIKPTLGLISQQGIIPIAHSQDTAGPMARNVTDAVTMLLAMLNKNEIPANKNVNYLDHLIIDGLKGKRIGVVRNLTGYHAGTDKVFEQAINEIKAQGAIIIDNTNLATLHQWDDAEFEVLLYEFKQDINHYLSTTAKSLPKSLSDLISINEKHQDTEMKYFDQAVFHLAQAKGPLSEKEYLQALMLSKALTQKQGIDKLIQTHQLDLLIAPTGQPAWKIDWINGDNYLGAGYSAAAVAGYPHITVPMGFVHHLPVGLSMFSGAYQEAALIEAAYSYEQATKHRKAPQLVATKQ
ncbi:amidase [Colwelliaceae bacterium 6471]